MYVHPKSAHNNIFNIIIIFAPWVGIRCREGGPSAQRRCTTLYTHTYTQWKYSTGNITAIEHANAHNRISRFLLRL